MPGRRKHGALISAARSLAFSFCNLPVPCGAADKYAGSWGRVCVCVTDLRGRQTRTGHACGDAHTKQQYHA
eukprot:4309376-Prymnesium_polylepis.1